jgi:hypothetical protein
MWVKNASVQIMSAIQRAAPLLFQGVPSRRTHMLPGDTTSPLSNSLAAPYFFFFIRHPWFSKRFREVWQQA